jgi:hypothetical protein
MGSRVEISPYGKLAFPIQKILYVSAPLKVVRQARNPNSTTHTYSHCHSQQIASSKWCAAHTTSNFDSVFTERDILPSEPKYILRLPEHCHLPPDLEKDSCQILCSKQHKEWSRGRTFADGKTVKWESYTGNINFGSVIAVLAILGAVIYFGSVVLLVVFFGAVILMLRSTARRRAVPETRSGRSRTVDFRSLITVWKSSCRRIKEAMIPTR